MDDRHEAIRKGGIRLRTKVSYWAVLVAAVTTLVTSVLWYVVFGNAWLRLRGIDPSTTQMTPQAWQMVGQVARNLVVALRAGLPAVPSGGTTPEVRWGWGSLCGWASRPWPSPARCCTRATRWGCT